MGVILSVFWCLHFADNLISRHVDWSWVAHGPPGRVFKLGDEASAVGMSAPVVVVLREALEAVEAEGRGGGVVELCGGHFCKNSHALFVQIASANA